MSSREAPQARQRVRQPLSDLVGAPRSGKHTKAPTRPNLKLWLFFHTPHADDVAAQQS
jgi:hypothetical protein